MAQNSNSARGHAKLKNFRGRRATPFLIDRTWTTAKCMRPQCGMKLLDGGLGPRHLQLVMMEHSADHLRSGKTKPIR